MMLAALGYVVPEVFCGAFGQGSACGNALKKRNIHVIWPRCLIAHLSQNSILCDISQSSFVGKQPATIDGSTE